MPISVQCRCGKRMGVSDALAGRSIRCSGCGEEIDIPRAGAAGKGAPGKAGAGKPRASPAIYMSSGKIVAICVVALIALGIILFITGPMRVRHQWDDDTGKKADHAVRNVLEWGMACYLSQIGEYDPSASHSPPAVDGEITFSVPFFVMGMPEKIQFSGKSTVGPYAGTYDTQTGLIDADVAFGGRVVAGIQDLVKAQNKFHMTGSETPDGHAEAESNGQKLQLVYPPKLEVK